MEETPRIASAVESNDVQHLSTWVRLVIFLGIPLVGSLACHHWLATVERVDLPLHSMVEAFGSFAALAMATLLLILQREREKSQHLIPCAAALLVAGILDAAHAIVQPGNAFVWLRSLSTLASGFLFALSWSAARTRSSVWLMQLPTAATIAAILAAVIAVFYPAMIPSMTAGAAFSRTAVLMNVIGGVFFLIAAVHFLIRLRSFGDSNDVLFGSLCLLFGTAGLLFPLSRKWDADWWFWHFIRLVAYAISMSRVFTTFRDVGMALRTANASLESNAADLEKANKLLLDEITERKRTEVVVAQQAKEILDISTPVLQVWKGVLIAPLIGTLDRDRSERLMNQLLERISVTQARVAILDITGVPVVDTATADHLLKLVQATRLVGTRCLLVGIRPSIAQTVVHLGMDLSALETYVDLQSGLQVAMKWLQPNATASAEKAPAKRIR